VGAIYEAATGLKSQQTRLDTIAANIANINTVGYKSQRVDFKDALYKAMDTPVGNSEAGNLRTGSGVLLGATTTDVSEGTVSETGNPLDFALNGKGYFTVQTPTGETLYTRNGDFQISVENGASYLVTAQGYYVLDSAGKRIQLPQDSTSDISVTESGVLKVEDTTIADLGITSFPNPDGLDAAGDTCYRATQVSGTAAPAGQVTVKQGRLEQSNVDLAQEMTLLIRSQRAYSLASKALQTADDMKGLANNIR